MIRSVNIHADECFANISITGPCELTIKPIERETAVPYKDPLVDWDADILPFNRGFFKEYTVDTGMYIISLFFHHRGMYGMVVGDRALNQMFVVLSKKGSPSFFEEPIPLKSSTFARNVYVTLNGLVSVGIHGRLAFHRLDINALKIDTTYIDQIDMPRQLEVHTHPYVREWFFCVDNQYLSLMLNDKVVSTRKLDVDDFVKASNAEQTLSSFSWKHIYGIRKSVIPQLVKLR